MSELQSFSYERANFTHFATPLYIEISLLEKIRVLPFLSMAKSFSSPAAPDLGASNPNQISEN
jgi:hypothetical protein